MAFDEQDMFGSAAGEAMFDPIEDDEDGIIAAGIPRHAGNGRPKIRDADRPTKFLYPYPQRASKLGDPLVRQYLIHRRELEQVTWAMGRSAALQDRARVVAGIGQGDDPRSADPDRAGEVKLDRETIRQVAADAIIYAGGRDAATRGTALHHAWYRQQLGEQLEGLSQVQQAAMAKLNSIMDCFTPHAAELFVVWDCARCSKPGQFKGRTKTHAGGSLDSLRSPNGVMRFQNALTGEQVQLTPDDRVVVDLKSGRWGVDKISYWTQLAPYGLGTPYVHVDDAAAAAGDNGRRPWPDNVAPNRQWALIPHVPLEHPEDASLVAVNVAEGAAMAHLAMAAGNAESHAKQYGFVPVELPQPAVLTEQGWLPMSEAGLQAVPTTAWLIEQVRQADMATLQELMAGHQQLWTARVVAEAQARLLQLQVPAS